jgi:hypothetical protein
MSRTSVVLFRRTWGGGEWRMSRTDFGSHDSFDASVTEKIAAGLCSELADCEAYTSGCLSIGIIEGVGLAGMNVVVPRELLKVAMKLKLGIEVSFYRTF